MSLLEGRIVLNNQLQREEELLLLLNEQVILDKRVKTMKKEWKRDGIISIQLSILYGIEKQLNERYQKSNRHLPGHSYESSECRHSPKRTEYLEQERAVLQEIISGKEAGSDISRTGMEKRQNKYLKERW